MNACGTQARVRSNLANMQQKNTKSVYRNSSSTRFKKVPLALHRVQSIDSLLHQHHRINNLRQGPKIALSPILLHEVAER